LGGEGERQSPADGPQGFSGRAEETVMCRILAASAFLIAATTAGLVQAQEAGGVTVGGALANTTVVGGNAINAAIGANSVATSRIGVVGSGVNVGGALANTTAVTGNAINAAVGANSVACLEIGVVGDTVC
jgi:hypothetical protein